MDKRYQQYVEDLNNDDVNIRLESIRKLAEAIKNGDILRPQSGDCVNNHIHTCYSFSPYSPTKAVWASYNAGLATCGIVDHDTVSGVREFIEAGKVIGMATTIGMECRVDFSRTPLKGRRINNPDQDDIAYVTLHGIPHTQIDKVKAFIEPYKEERNKRNRLMVDKINDLIAASGIKLDFDKDVVPISKNNEGGSITERHILFALAKKLAEKFGRGLALLDFLKVEMKLPVSDKNEKYLQDTENEYYLYDVLGVLKSDTSSFYIDATSECPDVKDFIKLADEVGAISAYAYLGDVKDSVTGDKRTQKFEDDYLEELFEVLKETGFKAVTYMPTRNSINQLTRLKALCKKYGFFEISGEDINSLRQSFICDAYKKPDFQNLIDSTWALIGHEKAATKDIEDGMFSQRTIQKYPDLEERIQVYKKLGISSR
ncbi:PHP domain-containing protein [Biomaibacter acetigenes]|uniref:PHP domain-containing protein n=1 Tax=Biomaibacter acetigenes TaxID=2316383 RepID=A0A3G2R421_9FIRM|nr:PHP domain-containing protein [Biomaibacter acetigenes]AYO30142.1 PHP domain-containing protein [Biomaibacter acetigenes]